MGWTISPNNHYEIVSGSLNDRSLQLKFTDNTTSSYTLRYEENGHCKEVVINRTGCETPPTPTPPTDCVAGTWTTTTSTAAVLSNAFGCTNENGSWEGGGRLTVEIRNNSDYYIPFNGEIKIKASPDINHHFRVPSIVVSAGESHYWYGRVTDKGQDSNFLVPPHAAATLTGCTGSFGTGTYHFYISILEGDDYKLHAEDLSFSNEVTVSYENNNKVIFTIPSNIYGTRWRGDNITTSYGHKGDFHYALTLDEVTGSTHCSRFHYRTDNGQGAQKVRIVPVHLNPNADWNAIRTALTEKDADGNYNLNGYYPYTIKKI